MSLSKELRKELRLSKNNMAKLRASSSRLDVGVTKLKYKLNEVSAWALWISCGALIWLLLRNNLGWLFTLMKFNADVAVGTTATTVGAVGAAGVITVGAIQIHSHFLRQTDLPKLTTPLQTTVISPVVLPKPAIDKRLNQN